MSVRRDKRFGSWFYRKWVRTSDGRKVRIFGTPKAEGLPETRVGAEEAERRAITRVLETGEQKQLATCTEVPTVRESTRCSSRRRGSSTNRRRCNRRRSCSARTSCRGSATCGSIR